MTDPTNFYNLPEDEQVKYSINEHAAYHSKLDDAIARLEALRTEVEDPTGLIRFSLADDGRLLNLQLADHIGQAMTNLGLEQRLRQLFSAGNEAATQSRDEFWATIAEYRPPQP